MEIYIISGEGEVGNRELYTGKRTSRALKARITKETCGSDRWAGAEWEDGEEINPDESDLT